MPLPALRAAPLLAAVALFLSQSVAHAAEVSSADEVDTSPGLSPDAVKRAFNQQRQTLVPCMRLLNESTPSGSPQWNPPADVDDRILLRFEVLPDGKVRHDVREGLAPEVEGLFLHGGCAKAIVSTWTFPSFPGLQREPVRVTIQARFSTTAAERKAELTRFRVELDAICQALSAVDGGKTPELKTLVQALQRYQSERRASIPWRMQTFVQALPDVAGIGLDSLKEIYRNGSNELVGTAVPCPKLSGWTSKAE